MAVRVAAAVGGPATSSYNEDMINLSRYWPLAILLLGLAGCSGSSTASTPGGKSAAELIESGNAALAQGELDEALADFNSALDVQPDSARARERRAAAFLQMKKFEQALNDCNAALKIDGKLGLGLLHAGTGGKGPRRCGKGDRRLHQGPRQRPGAGRCADRPRRALPLHGQGQR